MIVMARMTALAKWPKASGIPEKSTIKYLESRTRHRHGKRCLSQMVRVTTSQT